MKTTRIKAILKAGTKTLSEDISNNYGEVIGAFATIANEDNLPKDIVEAALSNVNSRPFFNFDIREWKRRSGGDFMGSMIYPLSINDRQLKFELATSTEPTNDVVMDVVLIHKSEKICENHELS